MIKIQDSYVPPGRVRVTYWLLFFYLVSFLSTYYGGAVLALDPNVVSFSFADFVYLGGVIPAEYGSTEMLAGLPEGVQTRRLYPLIPLFWYQFLHGGWFHLISNCLVLLIFGPNIELYMGRARFLAFMFTCGAVGALLQILPNLDSIVPIIGASGSVAGLFGAYLMVFPSNYIRITLGNIRAGNYRDFMLPVKVILVLWAASQLMDALIPTIYPQNKVAYLAHLGGFMAGYLLVKGRGGMGSARRNFKVFMGGKARGGGSR